LNNFIRWIIYLQVESSLNVTVEMITKNCDVNKNISTLIKHTCNITKCVFAITIDMPELEYNFTEAIL
jgi:hypothetical protein